MMQHLPEELVCEIIDHLPQGDLGRFNRVCRDFYRLGNEDKIWRKKGFLKRTFDTAFSAAGSETVPSSRLCHTCNVYKNKMYISGGHNTEADSQRFSEVKNDLFTYDFETQKWEKQVVKGLPSKTEHSTVLYDDKLWMFGGYSGHSFSSSTYVINLSTGTQSHLVKVTGDIPTGRSAHVGLVYADKLYVFGGWDGVVQNSDLFSLDFENKAWTRIQCSGEVPPARCSHSAVIIPSRKAMYIFGGYGGKTKNYLNDLWKFDFESQSWTEVSSSGEVPSPRSRMRMIEWNGKIYMFGGWDKTNHFDELHEFDLDSKMWSKIDIGTDANSAFKLGQHSVCVSDNILYVFGGYNAQLKKSTNDLFALRLGKLKRVDRNMDNFDYETQYKMNKHDFSNEMEIEY